MELSNTHSMVLKLAPNVFVVRQLHSINSGDNLTMQIVTRDVQGILLNHVEEIIKSMYMDAVSLFLFLFVCLFLFSFSV